jgi:hypothetical protein
MELLWAVPEGLHTMYEKMVHKTTVSTKNINHGKSTSPSPQILAAVKTTF